jgi:antitoxin CptB
MTVESTANVKRNEEAENAEFRRLWWRSRRGMLELDLALQPFVEHRLAALSAADQARYARLLDHDDWDVYDWVLGRRAPPDADLAAIVAEVQAARRP